MKKSLPKPEPKTATFIIKIQESLLVKFAEKCAKTYKSMSEIGRELIIKYVEDDTND